MKNTHTQNKKHDDVESELDKNILRTIRKIELDLESNDLRGALQKCFLLSKHYYQIHVRLMKEQPEKEISKKNDFLQLVAFHKHCKTGIISKVLTMVDIEERAIGRPLMSTTEVKSVLDRCRTKIAHIGNFTERIQKKSLCPYSNRKSIN